MSRFEKQLAFSVTVIYENIKFHRELLDKLSAEGGYFKPSLKNNLTRALNTFTELNEKCKDIKAYQKESERFVDDIYNFAELRNAKSKEEKIFNYPKEKELLPAGFLDSFMTFITTFEYCTDKLELTLKRLNCYEVFEKSKNNLKKYSDFVIDEVILYV